MEEFASMRERMASQREKNKAFYSNMMYNLRKIGKRYLIYKQETNSGPDNTHPKASEEDDDEEIVYKPLFLGHLKGGD